MRFYIYSRKSVYTGKGESIENQIEMCRQYIQTKFPDDAAEISVYEDEGFSAKNMDRPQFQQMLRDIRQKKPDFVICYRLDRISRNVSDFFSLVEELNDRNISLVCIKEEFDTSKPMGKAMMYIASVFAQLERETIAERVRDNLMMLARTGRWLGGTTPTGFTSEKLQEIVIDGKIMTSCKLKDNPEELRAVDLMFEKYLELRSVSGVSKYLIKQGIKSRNGKYYSLLGIKDILQNPVYCIADQDALAYFTEHGSDVCFDEKDCSDKYGLISYNKRDYKKKSSPPAVHGQVDHCHRKAQGTRIGQEVGRCTEYPGGEYPDRQETREDAQRLFAAVRADLLQQVWEPDVCQAAVLPERRHGFV